MNKFRRDSGVENNKGSAYWEEAKGEGDDCILVRSEYESGSRNEGRMHVA
jgi:hypothetical protein